MKIGEKVILPQEAASWNLIPGQIATVVEVEKSSFGLADKVTVQTADGQPYFEREYKFQPAF